MTLEMSKTFPPSTMKAWQYTSSSPSVNQNLFVNSKVSIPNPNPSQHLIQVLATALNPVDYKPQELPFIGRFFTSKPATPCCDLVGRIAIPAPGSNLKRGDLVFGVCGMSPFAGGGLAEYNVATTNATVKLPEGVDVEQAAGIGVAGLTAMQSIVGKVKKGDRVFINGGSGGVGMFGVQIAKISGCIVTTACSTRNLELCKGLGADDVVDYTKGSVLEALKQSGKKFDRVIDNVGQDEELISNCHEIMKPDAVYVLVAPKITLGGFAATFRRSITPAALGGCKRKIEGMWPRPNVDDLTQLGKWIQDGKIKVLIDSRFDFGDAPKAFERSKTGRARGKIVVNIATKNYEAAWE